jgi:antitoxin HicB
MSENHQHYSMLIEWSGHVVTPATHGSTYEEAVQHGEEVLEMLVCSALRDGEPLPQPKTHVAA